MPAANLNSGKYYFVDKDTVWNKLNPLTKTQGGLYRSDGTTWLAGVVPELAGVSDGTNILVDYPVVFSGVTVDNTAKTVTINSQTDNNFTDALKSTYDGYATTKLDKNTAITGATKTKITYDTNGLVTIGADATTADIIATTNKNYVTNADLTTISTARTTSNFIANVDYLPVSGAPTFKAALSTTAIIPAATWTEITFTNEVYDTNNAWNGTVFTVPVGKSGTYLFAAGFTFETCVIGTTVIANIGVNRNQDEARAAGLNRQIVGGTGSPLVGGSCLINLLAGETVSFWVYNSAGGTPRNVAPSAIWFSGVRIIGV